MLLAGQAVANPISGADAISIISEGQIVSSASVVPVTPPAIGTSAPSGTRIHELFVLSDGVIYLCFVVGNPTTETPPYATCHGS